MNLLAKISAVFFLMIVFSTGCGQGESTVSKKDQAKEIINAAIAAHGGENYRNMDVSFTFREYRVRLKNNNGNFEYSRRFSDSSGNKIEDVLTNSKFTRLVNDKLETLTEKQEKALSSSLNSVAYFALLPYRLADAAVIPTFLGDTSFGGSEYHKVAVSFSATGDRNNHQDDYCYWMNKKTKMVDFLSYKTGGPRFRKMVGRDTIAGIVFQNYENYAMDDSTINVERYDHYFLRGKMTLLSSIENSDFANNQGN